MNVTGEGLHRTLNLQIKDFTLNSNALLKWDITPDFYLDVYELERRHFQFRVDNDQTKFIDIEIPAHHASFHHLSLNIQKESISVPFHLRYQPASNDNRDEAEILVPSPEIHLIQPNGEFYVLEGDPFYVLIPIGNQKYLPLVDISTLFTVTFGALLFLRELFAK